MTTISNNNVNAFQNACLINIVCRTWSGQKKLTKSQIAKAMESDWVGGHKDLIDPAELTKLRKIQGAAKRFIEDMSLPFPVRGLTLVPKGSIEAIDDKLKEYELELQEAVSLFEAKYRELREFARTALNGLFNERDYPISISGRFTIEWQFVAISAPEDTGILTPEIYRREKEKFTQLMEETRNTAVAALRSEFTGIVSHMVERLTTEVDGKSKTFRDTLTGNFWKFFQSFKDRNIFEDGALDDLVEQAQSALHGVTPDELRDNDVMRGRVSGSMKQVVDSINSALVDRPTRKIKFKEAV